MTAVDTLPLAALFLAPELGRYSYPDEKLSDCSACPMEKAEPATGRPRFTSGSRCCTYAPEIMNFAVGRILRDGGMGAARVRKLLVEGQPAASGLKPSRALVTAYAERGPEDYGRRRELRCPYFVEGELGCSIWAHRNHVCRTWFCRHRDGLRGLAFWTAVSRVIERAEHLLAACCIADGKPPGGQRIRRADWEKWFSWCAQHVDRLEVVDLRRLEGDEVLKKRREQLAEARKQLKAPIPEVLGATVTEVKELGDGVVLTGYSPFQPARVPKAIFPFLGALDGRPWKEALVEGITEKQVVNLYRIGALGEWGEDHAGLPTEPDDP